MIVVEASSVADDFAIVLEKKSSCERKIQVDSMFCFAVKFVIKRLASFFLSIARLFPRKILFAISTFAFDFEDFFFASLQRLPLGRAFLSV
jgi:hypothetical protein